MISRFKIQPIKRTTMFLHRQRFYFTIKSNWNGQVIVHSEKYHNRKDMYDIMEALKAELWRADIAPEMDMDK